MTAYRQQLFEAVTHVAITSPTQFEWFGDRADRLPASVARQLDARQAREHLVSQLTAHLYAHFYCPGHARPERLRGLPARGSSDRMFEKLSAANSSHGGYEPGWRVTENGGTRLRVEKDGLTVDVASSDVASMSRKGAGSSAGATIVSVKAPRELTKTFPGFYVALSDEPWWASDGLVRLYWNVGPDDAVRLVSLATQALNQAHIGFRLKVLGQPSTSDRTDVAVLYVRPANVERVWDVAPAVLRQLRLRDAIPAMTKPLAPGLSVAEDPGRGQSFGMHRSGLVAEGIVRAREAGLRSTSRRLKVVLECLAEQGIDPDAPYLAPGAADLYSPIRLEPGRTTSREPARPLELDAAEALSVASLLGQRVLDSAIWHGDRCAWMGFEAVARRNTGSAATAYRSTGADIYAGTAGIARVLAELFAATGNPEFRRHAIGAITHALSALDGVPPPARLGLYTGWTGVACSAAQVGLILEREEYIARALDVAAALDRIDGSDHEFDLLGGLAGATVGQLALAVGVGRSASIDRAVALGDTIIRGAIRERAGWSWPSRAFPRQRNLTGFSHGASGIGFALLELLAATGLGRFREGAEQAFRFEDSVFDPGRRNWPDFRRIPGVDGRRPSFAVAWCHGAPGIALARLRAHELLGDATYLDQVAVAAATTRQAVDAAVSSPGPDWAACHGLIGNAEVLSLIAPVLDDDTDALHDVTRSVGLVGVADHVRGTAPWPTGPGEVEDSSTMLGLAGISLFYLRLARPATPSALLPTPGALIGHGTLSSRPGALARPADERSRDAEP